MPYNSPMCMTRGYFTRYPLVPHIHRNRWPNTPLAYNVEKYQQFPIQISHNFEMYIEKTKLLGVNPIINTRMQAHIHILH